MLRAGAEAPERLPVILARRPPDPAAERVVRELLSAYPLLFLVVGLAVLFQRLADPHAWRLALMFAGLIASAPIEFEHLTPVLRTFASYTSLSFAISACALFYAFFALFPTPALIHARWPWLLRAGLGIGSRLPA